MEKIFSKIKHAPGLKKNILFIGGFNQDIQMQAHGKLIPGDSVPGIIERTPGGVVRNIAENSSLLGMRCSLLSICGNDEAGASILKETEAAGVDCSHCIKKNNASSCIYSALLNEEGEMLYAVNQMDLIKELTPSLFETQSDYMKTQDHFVLDTNLSKDSISYICKTYPDKILLVDPVSTEKFERLRGLLSYIDIIKPNKLEAASYTGIELVNDSDYFRACEKFIEDGVSRVFISSGSKGIFAMDKHHHAVIPSLDIIPRSVTGAGDTASAALVLSGLSALSLSEAGWLANLSAGVSLLSTQAINKEMSIDLLKMISKEYDYEKHLS